jgi:hypothetical protein
MSNNGEVGRSSRGNLQLSEQVLQIIIIHEVTKKLNKKPYGDEELKTNP